MATLVTLPVASTSKESVVVPSAAVLRASGGYGGCVHLPDAMDTVRDWVATGSDAQANMSVAPVSSRHVLRMRKF